MSLQWNCRLTPVYAVILGFLATLVVYCGMGPSWSAVRMLSHGCRGGWWYNLLYINNLVELKADTSVRWIICIIDTRDKSNNIVVALTVHGRNVVHGE